MSGAPTDRPFRIYIPEETKAKAKKFLKKQAETIFDEIIVPLIELEAKNCRKLGKRKNPSEAKKKKVLQRQKYRCKICGRRTKFFDFDHIKDRSNNDIDNIQALCLDCHAEKTRRRMG